MTARSSATSNSNWRQPSATSSSASRVFTRFSNGSERSVSTVATSVSASSHFTIGGTGGILQQEKKMLPPKHPLQQQQPISAKQPLAKPVPRPLPSNVKRMQGVPWALDELPRQCHPHVNGQMPQGDIFGGPPVRRRKQQQPKSGLDTINERPKARAPRLPSPIASMPDASMSDLDVAGNDQPKKVQKGQINTLAKMLSALKTNRGRE